MDALPHTRPFRFITRAYLLATLNFQSVLSPMWIYGFRECEKLVSFKNIYLFNVFKYINRWKNINYLYLHKEILFYYCKRKQSVACFATLIILLVEPPRFATVFATPGLNFFILKTLGIIFLSVNHPVNVVDVYWLTQNNIS